MSWLSSLFGGQNSTLNKDINQTGQAAGFASSLGQQDLSSASAFNNALLSGDQSAIGKLLAPQLGSIAKRGQQQQQSLGMFGNRSGGVNAAVQNIGDSTRASTNDFISGLTGNAANANASMGSSLLSTGIAGFGQQAGLSQNRMQNWQDSIFGKGISSAIGTAEGFGLGKAFPSS